MRITALTCHDRPRRWIIASTLAVPGDAGSVRVDRHTRIPSARARCAGRARQRRITALALNDKPTGIAGQCVHLMGSIPTHHRLAGAPTIAAAKAASSASDDMGDRWSTD